VGHGSGAPFLLQRVLRFADAWFEPVPEPRVQDWLSLHSELMQTFDAFKAAFEQNRGRIGPAPERQCIHLLWLGPGEIEQRLLTQLIGLLAGFFSPLRVAPLRRPAWESLEGRREELDADAVLERMAAGLRADSALTLALTGLSLRSDGQQTFGATNWEGRVGVFSVGAYLTSGRSASPRRAAQPERDPADQSPASVEFTLSEPLGPPMRAGALLDFERIAKLLTHQAMHMFGILHCCYFRCLMNGCNTVEEVDSKPPYLCAMCLRKLHLVLGFDPLERYSKLASSWKASGHEETSLWYDVRVRMVRSTLPDSPPRPRSVEQASRRPRSAMRPSAENLLAVLNEAPRRPASRGNFRRTVVLG